MLSRRVVITGVGVVSPIETMFPISIILLKTESMV